MDWTDEGLVLGVRRHGESSAIVELLTRKHGRHLGLVRQGRSKRMRPILQPGNSVTATWRARLEDHLGTYAIEGANLRAATFMDHKAAIFGIQTLAGHLRLMPERDPHPALYDASLVLVEHLGEPEIAASLLIRFELALLEELGFGLDLASCAVSGAREELTWVSPKSGRAVSSTEGQPWADKLIPLPPFLRTDSVSAPSVRPFEAPDGLALKQGFDLCGHFLDRHIFFPRGLRPPDERAGFVRAVLERLSEGNNNKSESFE